MFRLKQKKQKLKRKKDSSFSNYMTNLNISYHNVDFSQHVILPSNNSIIIAQTQNILNDLPSLNIVRNSQLLNETIQQATQFANGKENFIVFGTGGSNLGAKALINILQGRERNNIIFHSFHFLHLRMYLYYPKNTNPIIITKIECWQKKGRFSIIKENCYISLSDPK